MVRWRCSPALTLGKRLSECGMNLIVKSEIHAANGDFDWLLFLTHVMTLSHSKDVFSPKVFRNALPAGANHLTH